MRVDRAEKYNVTSIDQHQAGFYQNRKKIVFGLESAFIEVDHFENTITNYPEILQGSKKNPGELSEVNKNKKFRH